MMVPIGHTRLMLGRRAATVATGLTCASGHDGGAVVFCGNLIEANVSLESKQCWTGETILPLD